MRWVIGCGALLLLAAGCGSTLAVGEGGTTASHVVLSAPSIQAVDRPADGFSSAWEDGTADESSATSEACITFYAIGGIPGEPSRPSETPHTQDDKSCPKPTSEEAAAMRADERRYHDAIRPADGASPRTVAELARPGGGTLELAAWSNSKGELCLGASSMDGEGSGADAGPFGPCLPDSGCDGALCFEELAREAPADYALIGVVPADADLATVTVAGGGVRAYPLTGPLVPGFPSQRVFMAALGPTSYRRFVVTQLGATVAQSEKSATSIAFEQCSDQLGSGAPEEMQAEKQRFSDCVRAATRTAAPAGG